MTLQSFWRSIPCFIRVPLRNALSRFSFTQGLLTSDFTTLTPETPPAVEKALARVAESHLKGDYYEFGIYRGYTFWRGQKAAQRLHLDTMRFFGFDSFQGLPSIQGSDAETREFKQGDYACTRSIVESCLNRNGVDWSRTHLIEGFFDASLCQDLKDRLHMRTAAVVLVDCDLYESTVPVLRFVSDLLQHGTILLFDDWNCFKGSAAHGERRAFAEFLAAHPEWSAEPFMTFGWHGQGFILNKAGNVC